MMQRAPVGVRFVEGGEQGGAGPAGSAGGDGDGGGEGGQGGQSGSEPGKAGEDGGEGRTFTQTELDSIIGKRLAKFSDYDQLKTELDQLKTAAGKAPNVDQALATQKAELEASHTAELLKAHSRGIAAELGFHTPAEAALYLDSKTLSGSSAPGHSSSESGAESRHGGSCA